MSCMILDFDGCLGVNFSHVHGVQQMWFHRSQVAFSPRFCAERPGSLATGPTSPPTHWQQAVLTLPAAVALGGAGAPAFSARISVARSRDEHRGLDISLEYGGDGAASRPTTVLYHMGVSS